jgi:hypothetical protein
LQEVAPSPPALPSVPRGAEHFAGEQQALERFFGPAIQVIDARDPTLFEDMAGLASILHLRRTGPRQAAAGAGDAELACGIGWFGSIPFVLAADFPRFGISLALPPADDAAVQAVLQRDGLVRHETRLDERGLAVLARNHGGQALFLLRVQAGQVQAEPYQPNAVAVGGKDQQRWLRHVETYERLVPLDQHRDGSADDIVVLTGDAGGHVWRHLVDPDGVETWRRPADDAAVATLYRERLAPGDRAGSEADPPGEASGRQLDPDPGTGAPADSLLATVGAFNDATAALRMACELARADPHPSEMLAMLYAVEAALGRLCAENTAGRCQLLLADAEAGVLEPARLARVLPALETSLHDELALIRLVLLQPAQWRRLTDAAPFGTEVEERFPGCAYDIEEAERCLVFRRPSAAVFHCMKVMERGLLALGRLAGVKDPSGLRRNWTDILASLAAGPAALAPMLGHVKRVRRRWRAPGLLPAEKYTEAEAEAVFQSVGAFMRDLAERCDERGEVPLAAGDGRPAGGR